MSLFGNNGLILHFLYYSNFWRSLSAAKSRHDRRSSLRADLEIPFKLATNVNPLVELGPGGQ